MAVYFFTKQQFLLTFTSLSQIAKDLVYSVEQVSQFIEF